MSDYLDFEVDLNHPDTVSALEELSLWSATFGLMLLKNVPVRSNMQVLDVGCGLGFPLLELAQRLGPSCRVYGIDPWTAALQRARSKARILNVRNVELIEGNASAMPFDDGQFDLVVSNLGINNFDEPDVVLSECRRVMAPSGRIALSTNLRGHMREFYAVYESTLSTLGKTAALERFRDHVNHRTTIEELTARFERAKLKITRVDRETSMMRFLDGSALLRHYFIKIGFLDDWKGVVEPNERREVFSHLENALNQASQSEGGLDLTIPMAYIEGEK